MSNGVSMQPAAWGQVRVREPAGERVLGEALTIGGAGSDVVVPGVPAGAARSLRRSGGVRLVGPASEASVRFNGRPLDAERDLRREDVLSVGDAQVRVSDASRTLLKLSVEHLAGNVTIAPAGALAAVSPGDGGDEELEIEVPPALGVPQAGTRVRATRASAKWLGWLAAAAGLAAGVIGVPAGERTISLRAPRYVDYTTTLGIEGAGARQELHVRLQPAWGALAVTAVPQGAHVSVDGVDSGAAPVSVAAPSGVRRIRIAASGWKTWASTVVLKGGQTLDVGPVTLGQPDAHLTVRSVPAGADVTIAGTHRGHTPLTVELPAAIAYPVVLSLPGYATWTRELFATAGSNLSAEARLAAVLARVKVSGEPADAELLVDGAPRGQTPQSLLLPAVEHRIAVRKAGFIPFEAVLTPVPELERAVQYHLTPSDRGRALLASAPLIRSQIGYLLMLVPPGAFQMGSERREQGRRPNEGLRTVTLQRPF